MKKVKYLIWGLAFLFALSCTDEAYEIQPKGNPEMEIEGQFTNVHFGDDLPFSATVSDEIPLSTLTAVLYFGEEEVSRTTIRTRENGVYSGTIQVPFMKEIPDGTATLEFILLNTTLKSVKEAIDVPITRAQYPYLILVTESGSYPMLPTGEPNEYAATESFPSTDLPGYIKSPVLDDKGNEIVFGWEAGNVVEGVSAYIPYLSPISGTFSVTFNTMTYETGPFFEIVLNDQQMVMVDKDNYELDVDLTHGQEITVEGLPDINDWWIDVDYLSEQEPGTYNFVPISGRYRITANLPLKYFRVEVLDGDSPAVLNEDGTGAIWIIGEHIGKPSVESRQVGWEPSRALSMAPIGDKKYQITVVGGETIRTDDINFKFFHQKDWGGEFAGEAITTNSDIIFIGDGTNGRDNGNLGILPEASFEEGATYTIVVDVSAGITEAVLTVTKVDSEAQN